MMRTNRCSLADHWASSLADRRSSNHGPTTEAASSVALTRCMQSVNFACSGAHTTTYVEPGSGHVKPGLDFNDGNGHSGQAQFLQDYATAHPHAIKVVVVLIGAGDFEWTELAKDCAEKWAFTVTTPGVWPLFEDLCQTTPGPRRSPRGGTSRIRNGRSEGRSSTCARRWTTPTTARANTSSSWRAHHEAAVAARPIAAPARPCRPRRRSPSRAERAAQRRRPAQP